MQRYGPYQALSSLSVGPVALTDSGYAVAAEDSSSEPPIEVVTCWFVADDYVDEVFYNGVPPERNWAPFVSNASAGCKLKTLLC